MAHDPRYVRVENVHAVMHYDHGDQIQVACETEEMARAYITGQQFNEGYSVQPLTVIRYLPETRILYMIEGRLSYDPGKPFTPQVDEYIEFPGIGNGEIVGLDEVKADLSEQVPYGWNVKAYGWVLAKTTEAFEEKVAEAHRLRQERLEAFARFALGCVVRTPDGETLLRITDRDGLLCWIGNSSRVIHDARIDPATLTAIAGVTEEGE